MSKKPERDPVGARLAKDLGIDQVMQGEERFADLVAMMVIKLPIGWRGIGEDLRIIATEDGIPAPHHHNAWGGVINGLIRQGYLRIVEEEPTRGMKTVKSHARKSLVLERVNPTLFEVVKGEK